MHCTTYLQRPQLAFGGVHTYERGTGVAATGRFLHRRARRRKYWGVHCADCGTWLDPDLDFCPSCGLEPSGRPNCPNCGEEFVADRAVLFPGEECLACNWRAGDDDPSEESPPTREENEELAAV